MKFNLQTSIDWCKIMKITCSQLFLALVFTGVSLADSGWAQNILSRPVNISASNMDLNLFLKKLEKKADIKFVYFQNVVEASKKVNINAQHQKLENLLSELLKPYNIGYSVVNDRIVLSKTSDDGSASSTNVNTEKTGIKEAQDVLVTG